MQTSIRLTVLVLYLWATQLQSLCWAAHRSGHQFAKEGQHQAAGPEAEHSPLVSHVEAAATSNDQNLAADVRNTEFLISGSIGPDTNWPKSRQGRANPGLSPYGSQQLHKHRRLQHALKASKEEPADLSGIVDDANGTPSEGLLQSALEGYTPERELYVSCINEHQPPKRATSWESAMEGGCGIIYHPTLPASACTTGSPPPGFHTQRPRTQGKRDRR
jgi:hypothetical protein